jgi:hypothetical protein
VATNLALPVYWGMSQRQVPAFADAIEAVISDLVGGELLRWNGK